MAKAFGCPPAPYAVVWFPTRRTWSILLNFPLLIPWRTSWGSGFHSPEWVSELELLGLTIAPFPARSGPGTSPSCSLGLGAQGLLASRQPHPAQAQRSGRGRQPRPGGDPLRRGFGPQASAEAWGGPVGEGEDRGGYGGGGQKPSQQSREPAAGSSAKVGPGAEGPIPSVRGRLCLGVTEMPLINSSFQGTSWPPRKSK